MCRRGPESLNTDTKFTLGGDGPESFWRDIILTRAECTSQKVMRLHDYWQDLRGDRTMPARSEIDAVEIWSLLPNIHVSEWHENPDRVRYRVAGTELVASIGREISGHWLTDFHTDPKDVAETMTLYRQVIARGAPIIAARSAACSGSASTLSNGSSARFPRMIAASRISSASRITCPIAAIWALEVEIVRSDRLN